MLHARCDDQLSRPRKERVIDDDERSARPCVKVANASSISRLVAGIVNQELSPLASALPVAVSFDLCIGTG